MARRARWLQNTCSETSHARILCRHPYSPGLSRLKYSAKLTSPGRARMQPLQQRGVPFAEREGAGQGPATPDWDAIRIFLEVARRGSFRSASDHLGLSINA